MVLIYPTPIRSTGAGLAQAMGRVGSLGAPVIGGILLAMHLPRQELYLAPALALAVGALAAGLMVTMCIRRLAGIGLMIRLLLMQRTPENRPTSRLACIRPRLLRTSVASMAKLAGRAAIVTGGAKGIGRHYSFALAAEGARVMIADIADGEEVAREISAKHGANSVASMICDVTDESSVKMLVAATMERFGQIDVLVNNAALFAPLQEQSSPRSMPSSGTR